MDNILRRPELLQVAESVAKEKSLDREDVIRAMEEGLARAARASFGAEKDIRVEVDRKTGGVQLFRWTEVVADAGETPDGRPFNGERMMPLSLAERVRPGVEVGGFIVDPLPPLEFGRLGAQAAKQAITQHVRETERKRDIELWRDRVGEIVNGTVKHVEFGDVVVDLGRSEGMLKRRETIQREPFKAGDRVRAYVMEVSPQPRGPQILLSRTHPGFLARLFAQEVPEIYDGVIEIKAVARDPGSRAKMAVISRDQSIDAVGACIGARGARVRPVTDELRGERIDIVPWSSQPATLIVNALAPAEVSKVVIDEDAGRVQVVVAEDQLSLAVGRRGQNVRLAAELTHWIIEVRTEAEESERRQQETATRSALFAEALEVDDVLARLLVEEGFDTVEDLIAAGHDELASVSGLDEAMAAELLLRAEEHLGKRAAELEARRVELGVSDEVAAFGEFSAEALVALGTAGVHSLDDLADLAGDELLEIVGADAMDGETADGLIMAARQHWFETDGETAEAAAVS